LNIISKVNIIGNFRHTAFTALGCFPAGIGIAALGAAGPGLLAALLGAARLMTEPRSGKMTTARHDRGSRYRAAHGVAGPGLRRGHDLGVQGATEAPSGY
jgi:hypothetical protein